MKKLNLKNYNKMEAKELRIGNFVKAKTTYDEFNVVKEIGFSDDQRGSYLRLENVNHGVWLEHIDDELILGIPLTEEWLLKFGFMSSKDLQTFDKEELSIHLPSDVYVKGRVYYNSWFIIGIDKLKHVHQLQNLYFALTGEELKIIEPKTL